jgi:hypothetical protein
MTGFEFFHRYPEDKEKRDEYGGQAQVSVLKPGSDTKCNTHT